MKYTLPVHPEEVTKSLFSALNKRTKDILEQRFGLGKNTKRMTLDAIGQKYDITRERVRQIEADGFSKIKKSQAYAEAKPVFSALENYFDTEGRVIKETKALGDFAPHPKHENHIYFLLSLHDPFLRHHESDELYDRWSFGDDADGKAKQALDGAVSDLRGEGKPVPEKKLFEVLSSSAKRVLGGEAPSDAVLANWIGISKLISKNYFDEWGLTEFPEIKPRGVRDLSYMVMLRHGKPLHFSEVADKVTRLTNKKAHVQTVHNELIKDPRFVLVGRGLYALKNWGYAEGVVKDIISEILQKEGALSKEKIVEKVLKEREVKPNTIAINLENKTHFKKLADGRFFLK